MVVALMTLSASNTFAQCTLPVRWANSIQGGAQDFAADVSTTFDGGYAAVGWSMPPRSAGGSDLILTKYTQSGDTLWSRIFGGTGNDDGNSIIETEDLGLMCIGSVTNVAGNTDVLILKFGSSGDFQWSRTYGGAGNDYGRKILRTSLGHLYVVGYTNSFSSNYDHYILRLTETGDTLWSRTIGSVNDDYGYSACESDDKVIVVGTGNVQRNVVGHVIAQFGMVSSIDTNGNVAWSMNYDYVADSYGDHLSWFSGVSRAISGELILVGGTDAVEMVDGYPYTHHPRVLLTKISASGNLVRQRIWPLVNGGWICARGCNATRAYQLEDQSFYVTGTGNDYCSKYAYVAHVDSMLNLLTFCRYGGHSEASVIGHDGGMVLCGQSNTDDYNGSHSLVFACETDSVLQELKLIQPNGGEGLPVLDTVSVSWADRDYTCQWIKMELNRNYPNGVWEILADSTANDGQENFMLTGPAAERCRVRISTLCWPWFSDVSDSNFTITASTGYLAMVGSAQQHVAISSWNAGALECPEQPSVVYHFKNFGSQSLVAFPPSLLVGEDFLLTHDCPPFFALAPGEISTCSIGLTYAPQSQFTHRDSVMVMSNAFNAVNGFVSIPLSGSQIRTPESPEVVISTVGYNSVLRWSPILESIGHCQIDPPSYLVFFSEDQDGPFWFHGGTNDTTYTHVWAIQHTTAMFYHVYAVQAEPGLLAMLPAANSETKIREADFMQGFYLPARR